MVRILVCWSMTRDGSNFLGDKGLKMTARGIAEEAARQMAEDGSYLKQAWENTAKDAGIVAFSSKSIRAALGRHFKPGLNRAVVFDYEDGCTRLTVTRKGKTTNAEHNYQIGVNPLATRAQKKDG